MRHTLNENAINQIACDYYNKKNIFLCEKYHCSDETLRKFLRKNDIKRKLNKQIILNEDFFEIIDSEEKAYFLGFICADGSINERNGKLSFTLNPKDINILYKFRSMLKINIPISQRTYNDKRNNSKINTSGIQIYSRKIINDLSLLGVNQNKSNTLDLPNINKNLIRHFIRGMFDGDGHIGTQCSLISTMECLNSICAYLKEFDIHSRNYTETINEKKNVFKKLYGKDRIKLLRLLYDNSNIYLERKYLSFLNEIDKYNLEVLDTTTQYSVLMVDENIVFESIKECANYLNVNYCNFTTKLKRGDFVGKYEKYEKICTQKLRNGKIIIERTKIH